MLTLLLNLLPSIWIAQPDMNRDIFKKIDLSRIAFFEAPNNKLALN